MVHYLFDFTEEQPENRIKVMIITKQFERLREIVDGIFHFYGIYIGGKDTIEIVNTLTDKGEICIKCNKFYLIIDLGDIDLPKNHGMRRNMVFCDKELAYKDYENNEKYQEFEDCIESIVTVNGLSWFSDYIPNVFII